MSSTVQVVATCRNVHSTTSSVSTRDTLTSARSGSLERPAKLVLNALDCVNGHSTIERKDATAKRDENSNQLP